MRHSPFSMLYYHHHHHHPRTRPFDFNNFEDSSTSSTFTVDRHDNDKNDHIHPPSSTAELNIVDSTHSTLSDEDQTEWDDCSCSCLEQQEQQQEQPITSQKKRRKSVRFDESQNVEYTNTVLCQQECRSLWYGTKDLRTFKDANFIHGKEIELVEKATCHPCPIMSYTRLLRRTYQACCCAQDDDDDDDDNNMNETSNVLTESEEQSLGRMLSQATSRLGMERTVVRANARDAHFRRQRILKTVKDIQELENTTGIIDDIADYKDAKAELIRSSCEALSRPSRLYAQVLAKAQVAQ